MLWPRVDKSALDLISHSFSTWSGGADACRSPFLVLGVKFLGRNFKNKEGRVWRVQGAVMGSNGQ